MGCHHSPRLPFSFPPFLSSPAAQWCRHPVTPDPTVGGTLAQVDPPLRKKLKRRQVKDGARFLTFSSYRRLKLLGTPRLRDAFAAKFQEAHERFGFLIIAWVIMPEHVHLMICPAPGESDLVVPLTWLKRESAKQVIGRWRLLSARVL